MGFIFSYLNIPQNNKNQDEGSFYSLVANNLFIVLGYGWAE